MSTRISLKRALQMHNRPQQHVMLSISRCQSSSACATAAVLSDETSSSFSSSFVTTTTTTTIPTTTTHNTKPQHYDPNSSHQKYHPIYVAATRQHVGKTSVSLALMSGLVKRFDQVGFCKPVGQKYLHVQDTDGSMLDIDKDAVLIKSHFGLDHLSWRDTSPVLIPPGYTKDYLDGKIQYEDQINAVMNSFDRMSANTDIILCEGTGHTSVGSIVDASNADMAAMVGAKMVLVANGGLGNAFDELNLNRNFCLEKGVDIAGVIINQIKRDKFDQTVEYLTKALHQKWGGEEDDVPLLGCIPDRPFLGCAALCDLERLFNASFVSPCMQQHALRHYRMQDVNLVAHSLEVFLKKFRSTVEGDRNLYICHASRSDIILGYLMECVQRRNQQIPDESAMIITGCDEFPISTQVLEIIASLPKSEAPAVLLTAAQTDQVMYGLYSYTPKLNINDTNRVNTAISHYEPHINFDLLLERVTKKEQQQEQPLVAASQ